MTIRPIYDRLVVRPVHVPDMTPSGLYIPEVARDKPLEVDTIRATVRAVGPGRVLDDGTVRPLPFAVGDDVVYRRFDGTIIELDGEELTVLREEEVLAVCE